VHSVVKDSIAVTAPHECSALVRMPITENTDQKRCRPLCQHHRASDVAPITSRGHLLRSAAHGRPCGDRFVYLIWKEYKAGHLWDVPLSSPL